MVSSLQSIVLYSVPIAMLFDLLKTLWHLPMRKDCLRAQFRRCTHERLRDWAKTLSLDHPVARSLDHEVHRRRMAGEFCFHYTLKHYGGWIRPVQLRCHYSTVKCVISLHETFQM